MRRLLALPVLVAAFAAFSLVPSAVSQTEGTTITTATRWTCAQPLASYGPPPLTLVSNVSNEHALNLANGMVNLNAGCVGDGDPDTFDLCLHVNGDGGALGSSSDALVTRGARDIDVGCPGDERPNIDCGLEDPGPDGQPGTNDDAHQDGVATHEGYNITFTDTDFGNWAAQVATCHGAGAVFYPSAGVNEATRIPERAVGIVCDGCRIVGSKHPPAGTALGIYESTDSGARDSCLSAFRPFFVRLDGQGPGRGAIRPVNERNLLIDRDSADPQPSPDECGSVEPPPTTTEEPPTTTEPPPTTTVEDPPPYEPECAPLCDERIDELQEALLLALADLDQARQERVDCRRKLSAVNKRFHAGRGVYSLHRPIHWVFGCTGFREVAWRSRT